MPIKLKVGFDMDGVILYNPIRFLRSIAKSVKFLKPVLFHQKKDPFYFPKSSPEKFIWKILHKTSFRLNDGFEELCELIKNYQIEAYIITGRYGMLEGDFKKWLKIIEGKKVFKKSYANTENLQPNEFKKKIINQLKLDYYVEDNWDIVEKLNHHTKAEILWITNFLDKRIAYPNKFDDLMEVENFLKKKLKRQK